MARIESQNIKPETSIPERMIFLRRMSWLLPSQARSRRPRVQSERGAQSLNHALAIGLELLARRKHIWIAGEQRLPEIVEISPDRLGPRSRGHFVIPVEDVILARLAGNLQIANGWLGS